MKFFASKKRKSQSPGLKTGRFEKSGRTTVEGSPSAKGTLDNYLRTSQEDNGIVHPSCAVKRNLVSEIDKTSNTENEQFLLSAEEKSQSCGAAGEPAEGTAQGSENLELKQFATDFLSLYCR